MFKNLFLAVLALVVITPLSQADGFVQRQRVFAVRSQFVRVPQRIVVRPFVAPIVLRQRFVAPVYTQQFAYPQQFVAPIYAPQQFVAPVQQYVVPQQIQQIEGDCGAMQSYLAPVQRFVAPVYSQRILRQRFIIGY